MTRDARGIDLRPFRSDEIDALCALINRAEAHDGIPRILTAEELREELDVPYIDFSLDTRVAIVDGDVAGATWVWHRPSEARLDRAHLFGTVDPAYRGRGIGHGLIEWGVERATARLREGPPDLPRYLRVDAYDWQESNHRLFARFGFTPARWFEELIRPLDDLPEREPPAGISLGPWDHGRDEEARQVHVAAFADHWGTAPVDKGGWHQMVHGHGGRPDLSVMAVADDTDEMVGICLNHAYPEDDEVTGRHDAWIAAVGTRREERGRGLASAMLTRSLANFRGAGFSHAVLGVDADSPTGAAQLYRGLGFEGLHRSITHQIEIT